MFCMLLVTSSRKPCTFVAIPEWDHVSDNTSASFDGAGGVIYSFTASSLRGLHGSVTVAPLRYATDTGTGATQSDKPQLVSNKLFP